MPAESVDPLLSGYPKHTTTSSQSASGFVITITHPAHPLRGQQVEVIRLRRGPDPDLIIRLPDGSHSAIAASSTDYAVGSDREIQPSISAPSLLDLDGLFRIAQLFDQLREQGRFPEQAPGPGTSSFDDSFSLEIESSISTST
jgi:hypothetical protein